MTRRYERRANGSQQDVSNEEIGDEGAAMKGRR